jgi:hypothetical protein
MNIRECRLNRPKGGSITRALIEWKKIVEWKERQIVGGETPTKQTMRSRASSGDQGQYPRGGEDYLTTQCDLNATRLEKGVDMYRSGKLSLP